MEVKEHNHEIDPYPRRLAAVHQYLLLITAAGHAVVVDPAAEAETYLAQLKENNATLTDIFLTHGHYDHVGSVTALKKPLALRCIWTWPMPKATRCTR